MALSNITNLESMSSAEVSRKIWGRKRNKYRRISEITVGIEDAVNKMSRAGMDAEEIERILGLK